MNTQAALQSYTLTASKELTLNLTGSRFWLVNTTGALKATFDDKGELDLASGVRFKLPEGDLFTRIRFKNPDSSSSVTFHFYAGDLDIDSVSPVVFFKPSPTYPKCATFTVTNGTPEALASTNLRTGKTSPDSLSHVIISNNSGKSVHVADASGTVGMVIPDGSMAQITTSSALYLQNPTGAPPNPQTIRVMYFFNIDS